MKLITHNHLRCHAKNVATGFPLNIHVDDFKIIDTEYNEEFISGILKELDWTAVKIGAKAIGFQGFPDELTDSLCEDDNFLRACHKLLLDVNILKGTLTCPESGRVFLIDNGVADMSLTEADL